MQPKDDDNQSDYLLMLKLLLVVPLNLLVTGLI